MRAVVRVVLIVHAFEAGIRLKEKGDDEGDYTLTELYDILAEVYT